MSDELNCGKGLSRGRSGLQTPGQGQGTHGPPSQSAAVRVWHRQRGLREVVRDTGKGIIGSGLAAPGVVGGTGRAWGVGVG